MLGMVERFDADIGPREGFRAVGRAEKIDVTLRIRLCGEATKAILRHVRGGMPAGHLQGRALKDTECRVAELKPAGWTVCAVVGHKTRIVRDGTQSRQTVDGLPHIR